MKNNEDIIEQKRTDIIDEARNTNLAGYLLSKGVPLIRNGRRYKDKEHDSLVFTDSTYYWNSKQESGNAVDYLTRYMGFSFNGAVKELTGADTTNSNEIIQYTLQTKKIQFLYRLTYFLDNLNLENDMRRTIAYLNKTRYIDNDYKETD